ncbi:hypothetical protein PR002_g28788 [Phytophthora rubi]|uniref:Uncharacterized protein n=1 Tax=Phytophthora rubi TaxID=129364 RepID=A0A6A3H8F6_9STRA|nr:hypothetical protein PR002_g28788 [Phytophthora rubi]
MASCGWPAARFVVVWWRSWRGGVANDCSALILHATAASGSVVAASELEHGKMRLASSKRRRARATEDGGGVRAADRMLQLPSSKRCPTRVTEDGGGVRTADGKLPLPSRRFMTGGAGATNRAIYFVELSYPVVVFHICNFYNKS